jgi:hypothetical protein
LARGAYRGLNDLARQAATAAPLPLSAYARIWGVWGRDIRKFALIDPDRRFLYATNPKAANSTIRRLLWRHRGVEVTAPDLQRVLHGSSGPYVTLPDLAFDERKSVLTEPGVYRFSFVRNPYSRLRSAFRQKILQPALHESAAPYLANIAWSEPRQPTFAEFVRLVVDQSDARMNIHWKPQHLCLGQGVVDFDFIGRVERFEDDIRTVLDRIGADKGLYQPKASVNRLPPSQAPETAYTDEMAAAVFARYRRDFDQFGYEARSYGAQGDDG